jgi:protein TonB
MAVSEDSQPDHYATLGLSPDATSQEIENAFHARVREHLQHSNVADKPIRERARQVGLAYETLRDPAKRQAYDEARAPAESADLAAPTEAAARVRPPLVSAPAQMPEWRAADRPAARSESIPTPLQAEPEPEPERTSEPEPESNALPVEAYNPVEPADEPYMPPQVATPIPVEAVAAHPVGDPEPEDIQPTESVADQPTEPTGNWQPTAGPVVPLNFVDEPPAEEAAMVPWRTKRPRGRGLLAAAALVMVLGVGGLLFTEFGNRAGQTPVHAVLPVAVTRSQLPASAPPNGQLPGQANAGSTDLAQQSSQVAMTGIPAGPVSAATARIPPGARTATAVVPPPATTVEVKLPPPAPSTAAPTNGSTAAPATTAAASTVAAAPPSNPAPAPAAATPPSPPAPVRQQVSTQPFPRWLGGGIMNSDNPHGQYVGTVSVRFTVQPNGRVGDCRPVASSGNPALDANTCSLVEQRLRFSPALNALGQPISSEVRTSYTWGRTTRPR